LGVIGDVKTRSSDFIIFSDTMLEAVSAGAIKMISTPSNLIVE
jgi:hypothetical protein